MSNFKSGHKKNILEPETSRLCVSSARYAAVTLVHLLLKKSHSGDANILAGG